MQGKAIKRLVINGLHQYLNIELNLKPGLNVIYGKNGKGKTTALHVLANILELDFQRFIHLQFSSISIESFESAHLEIIKNGHSLLVYFNGNPIGSQLENALCPRLSETECDQISEAFGGRPVYLPAYRAILERVRPSAYDTPKDSDYEAIKKSELNSQIKSEKKSKLSWRGNEQRASLIARKTVQCREWFGPFVPVIRYPALAEVIESISEEFTDAQMEASQSERRMLSSMFIGVFKSLVSTYDTPSDGEIEPLIERVKNSLEVESDDGNIYPDQIVHSLAAEIAETKIYSSDGESAAQKRVLKLYAEMLERRNQEKLQSFYSIKKFETAVNHFLDGKKLRVSSTLSRKTNRWREYIFIETENKGTYPVTTLSSGERQIVTMLFSATRMSTLATGTFLIDEPELSLHVDWQRIILRELHAQAPSRQIIACTHSPEVGADHDEAVQMFTPRMTVLTELNPGTEDSAYMDDLI
jgi:predicted ATP-binding protein involved in virulence